MTKFLEYLAAVTLIISVILTSFNVYPLNLKMNILNSLIYILWYERIGARSQTIACLLIIIPVLIGLLTSS